MSSQPKVPDKLAEGLIAYYSSQAEIMLAQYENINRLLGDTSNWTQPGEFCEILFREFLRKYLPPSVSADKGFYYGRDVVNGFDIHCPEVDILIHDTERHKPLFRLGDFVIVKPQAVKGMIQVKRNLDSKSAAEGLQNIATAGQLLYQLWDKKMKDWGNHLVPQIFTAIVAFKDSTGKEKRLYESALNRIHAANLAGPLFGRTLPTMMGSLQGGFVYRLQQQSVYQSYNSTINGHNVYIQALLQTITQSILETRETNWMPHWFPDEMRPKSYFVVHGLKGEPKIDNSLCTITAVRTDGVKFIYRKVKRPAKGWSPSSPSLTYKDRKLVPTDIGKHQELYPVLFVDFDGTVEKFTAKVASKKK